MENSTCQETVKVVYPGRQFGLSKDDTLDLQCCLMAPHPDYKHYNPRLQLTVGGDRIKKDASGKDITETWNYFPERKRGLAPLRKELKP